MNTVVKEYADDPILIVEDSMFTRKIISNQLKSWGFSYFEAKDGIEAWEKIAQHQPKIVLLDWNVPGMDGIELCKRIRSRVSNTYTYVIMLTSMEGKENILTGMEAGADDYVLKPFDPEVFHSRILVGWRIVELERNLRDKVDELKATQNKLVETAHKAGMAEIATSVLHNVGNVLSTSTTAAAVIANLITESKSVNSLSRFNQMINEHKDNFKEFINNDPRGEKIPAYLESLIKAFNEEQKILVDKYKTLAESIDHIKDIIALQQDYTRQSGIKEEITLETLIDQATQLFDTSFLRHDITLKTNIDNTDKKIVIERQKILQILVNFLQNAKDALKTLESDDRTITINASTDDSNLILSVKDNGVGIEKEKIDKIFGFGFTTKDTGNGFGLHSCANSAKEMGGSLKAFSEGLGNGAEFVLKVPFE